MEQGPHGGFQTVWCDKTTSAARLCDGSELRLDRGQGSSDWHRGFVWQPLGATQRIWSEPSAALGRASAWRIQVGTEFPGLDGPSPRMVSMEAPLTALSAVVRSMTTGLASSWRRRCTCMRETKDGRRS